MGCNPTLKDSLEQAIRPMQQFRRIFSKKFRPSPTIEAGGARCAEPPLFVNRRLYRSLALSFRIRRPQPDEEAVIIDLTQHYGD